MPPETRVLRRRASSAASANSHFRKLAIFGKLDVTFGQTIQYALDSLKEISIGLTSRPLMTSRFFEVTMEGEIVWEYVNPFFGKPLFGGPPSSESNQVFRAIRYSAEEIASARKA
jgi:hypothetical protein